MVVAGLNIVAAAQSLNPRRFFLKRIHFSPPGSQTARWCHAATAEGPKSARRAPCITGKRETRKGFARLVILPLLSTLPPGA